jgi:hypothetical protein
MSSIMSYPQAEWTPCVDKPTPKNSRLNIAELSANAKSISSILGGGGHGASRCHFQ